MPRASLASSRTLSAVLAAVAVALVPAAGSGAQGDAAKVVPVASAEDLRGALAAARAAREGGELRAARGTIGRALEAALARPAAERDGEEGLELLAELAQLAHELGELAWAERARRHLVEVRGRAGGPLDPGLLRARQDLASTLYNRGDLAGARDLDAAVLAAREELLPPDHPDLARARSYLAMTLYQLGDLAGARSLQEAALETRERTLPADHPDVLSERTNLAVTIKGLGDLAGARRLQESVLAARERTLSPDHPQLLLARANLAATLLGVGEVLEARDLLAEVLAARERVLAPDDPQLLTSRANLALALRTLGDLAGARVLQEAVLAAREAAHPADHPEVLAARASLASTLRTLGDLRTARALEETVLAARERTRPPGHPDLLRARAALAVTLKQLGDAQAARALEEEVLALREQALAADDPELQAARSNLAATLKLLGDASSARPLEEAALAALERTLPPGHPRLQMARGNLATTLALLGEGAAARRLREALLAELEGTLPGDHPQLLRARQNLAASLKEQGRLDRAREQEELVLARREETLPAGHPDLRAARVNLAVGLAELAARRGSGGGPAEGDAEAAALRSRCLDLLRAVARSQVEEARAAVIAGSVREAEERGAGAARILGALISFGQGVEAFPGFAELVEPAFAVSESTRGLGLAVAWGSLGAAGEPEYAALRGELRRTAEVLAALAQGGAGGAEYHRARQRREDLERRLTALAERTPGPVRGLMAFDVRSLAHRLGEDEALVAFRRYPRWRRAAVGPAVDGGQAPLRWDTEERLAAFVLRRAPTGGARLELVDLADRAAIDGAVGAWRRGLAAGPERGLAVEADGRALEAGIDLRRRVWDPLLPHLAGALRVRVALDDVLHLVPFDALPLDGGEGLLGERWRIEQRLTLWELLGEARPGAPRGGLVSLGGASFNSLPAESGEAPSAAEQDGASAAARGPAWDRSFGPLTYAGLEAREVAALFEEVFEGSEPLLLERRGASRAALAAAAPGARWLHVATHGWFAPESIRSWGDPDDGAPYASGEEVVRGMSPMLLAGLALAGANLPSDAAGRVPGLVTAEELSGLDLSGCELAVLSACDTNVGELRAGQGVASLQKALHQAGARSVITSLWKVPDGATRELMLDFYRRLWVEGKPKDQALWEAKLRLRDAVDGRGEPLYSLRDWAAWVLTGEPE